MNQTVKQTSFFRQCIEFIGLLLIVFVIRTFIFGLYQVPTGSMETTMLVGERFFADKLSYWLRAPKRGEIVALIQPVGYKLSSNPAMELFQRYVWGPQNWTKRVIGGPGDHVRGVIEDGFAVVYLNGQKLNEPYLNRYPLIRTHLDNEIHDRSFDPALPLYAQPFYRLKESEVVLDATGNPRLKYPSEVVRSNTPPELRGNRFWDGSDEFSVQLKNDEYWLMGDNRRGSKDSRYFGPVKQKDIFARIVFRLFSIDSDESWLIIDIIKNPVAFWHKIRHGRNLQLIQ